MAINIHFQIQKQFIFNHFTFLFLKIFQYFILQGFLIYFSILRNGSSIDNNNFIASINVIYFELKLNYDVKSSVKI